MKKGVFLLNLGTPESPKVRDVRKYLNEFLNDPYVIDLPYLLRKLLVNGIILNTRPKNSAEAYRQIWTDEGSPLLIHSKALANKVQALVDQKSKSEKVSVKMGMRYGKPSMTSVLEEFKKEQVEEIVFFPLYPHYSYAASESSIERFKKLKKKMLPQVKTRVIDDFFDDPNYIRALANSMREAVNRFKPDLLLLSYHGIPERQLGKVQKKPQVCCSPGCCESWNQKNEKCYRAQCFETSRRVAQELGMPVTQVETAFQSRLGRTKWIEPYTDKVLAELPARGIKRILVASPSFTADCLETLEEIKIRYDELFKDSGGVDFEYVPCLNSRDEFTEFVYKRIQSLT